jgi:hypothetical protein
LHETPNVNAVFNTRLSSSLDYAAAARRMNPYSFHEAKPPSENLQRPYNEGKTLRQMLSGQGKGGEQLPESIIGTWVRRFHDAQVV